MDSHDESAARTRDAFASERARQEALVASLLDRAAADAAVPERTATHATRSEGPAADASKVSASTRPSRVAAGLAVHRANAAALAARALGAAFPTVRAFVGAATFERLAHDHWLAAPPDRGDVGEWGAGFAAWLEAQAPLSAWPFLGDAARVDHAVHACERAADATFDAASLALLEFGEPDDLCLRFRPGTRVLRSSWPVATLHAAHRDAAEPDVAQLRAALASGRGESVLVARRGWRAVVHRVDDVDAGVAAELLSGAPLGSVLGRAGSAFDFTAWLAQALRGGWLERIECQDGDTGARHDASARA